MVLPLGEGPQQNRLLLLEEGGVVRIRSVSAARYLDAISGAVKVALKLRRRSQTDKGGKICCRLRCGVTLKLIIAVLTGRSEFADR